MKTFIIIVLTLIFGFFFFFWMQGVLIIYHAKQLTRKMAKDMGYTKEDEKRWTPEEYIRYLKERQWREEQLERMTHEANLEDPNYYNNQYYNSYRSYDDFID